jgi:hypothetical protein
MADRCVSFLQKFYRTVPALRATTTHEYHVRPHEFLHRRPMEGSGQLQAPSALFSSEMTLCTQCIMLSHPDVLMEQIILDIAVGIAATCFTEPHSLGRRPGYRARKQRNHGLTPARGKRCFYSPKRPDHFWGPASL